MTTPTPTPDQDPAPPGPPTDPTSPATPPTPDPLDVALFQVKVMSLLAAPLDNATTAGERAEALMEAQVKGTGKAQAQAGELAAQMAQVSLAADVRKIANALPLLSATIDLAGKLLLPYAGQLLNDVTRIAERIDADAFRVTATTEGGDQEIYARSFTAAAGLVDELTDKGAEAVNIAERDEDGLWNNVAIYQQGAWHL